MADEAIKAQGDDQEDDWPENWPENWHDDAPPDPWMAEMTRKSVEAIRTLKGAGLWEAFHAAMDGRYTPAREAAFFRDHGLTYPDFPISADTAPSPPAPAFAPASAQRGRAAPDAVWARAREDYLAGEAAETVCARHGLGVSTLRARASAEGWRRADQPDPEPVDLDAEYEDDPPSFNAMLRHAEVRLNRAILRGRAAEASSWLRVHERVKALARLETARLEHEAREEAKEEARREGEAQAAAQAASEAAENAPPDIPLEPDAETLAWLDEASRLPPGDPRAMAAHAVAAAYGVDLGSQAAAPDAVNSSPPGLSRGPIVPPDQAEVSGDRLIAAHDRV